MRISYVVLVNSLLHKRVQRTNVDLGHGNVELPALDGAGPGQTQHGVLGACIRRRVGTWDVRSERTIIDYSTCQRNAIGERRIGYHDTHLR